MVTENMEKKNIFYMQEEWTDKVKYPYRKCLKIDCMYHLILVIVFPALMYGRFHDDGAIAIIWTLVTFFSMLLICMVIQRSVLLEYLDEKHKETVTNIVSFYEVDYFYRHLDQEPVTKLYPSMMMVRRMELKCKSTTKYYCFGIRKRYVIRCVGSYRKERALYSVFFPKEGRYVRRKESHPFKVTYTKYNKSLIRLDMVEGEEYPEGFTAKLEKINSMF